MTKNMGTIDRLIRTAIGIGIGILYFTGNINGTVALVLGVIALVFIATSVVGNCPAYPLLGISTRRKIDRHAH